MNLRKIFRIFWAALAFAAITFSLGVRAQAQTETVLYSFSGGSDGALPNDSITMSAPWSE